jgi:esterase/lipase
MGHMGPINHQNSASSPERVNKTAKPLTQDQAIESLAVTRLQGAEQTQPRLPTIKKPASWMQRFVASCILPALGFMHLFKTRKKEAVIDTTQQVFSDANPRLAPFWKFCTSGAITLPSDAICDFNRFTFNELSNDYTIIKLPLRAVVNNKIISILEECQNAKKNCIVVTDSYWSPEREKSCFEEKFKALVENIQITCWISISKNDVPVLSNFGQEIAIPVEDTVTLSGIVFRPKRIFEKPADQKWIVYFHQNAASWEDKKNTLDELARNTGANVLSCNYRGVGKSTGFPKDESDLLNDGKATIEYLLKQGIKPENIVVYGASLGGAIATHVAADCMEKKQGVALCTDRSFKSLPHVIKELVPILGRPIAALAKWFGWNLNSEEKFNNLRRQLQHIKQKKILLIYHEKDEIVRIRASVHHVFTGEDNFVHKMRLNPENDQGGSPHNRLFSTSGFPDQSESEQFYAYMKSLLG